MERTVTVSFEGGKVKGGTSVAEYRIDTSHANAIATWQTQGSPPKPSAAQVAALVEASKVVPTSSAVTAGGGSVDVAMSPNSAVVLVFKKE